MVCALVASTATVLANDVRGVIELFTSQGCSSCPAADQLLGQLANDPTLVAMSLPIDYWDYLGWKDTLAKPTNTARQRAYAQLRGDRAVYTPQVVVNGAVHVQGSDKAAIEEAIVETHAQPGMLSLPVGLSVEGGRVKVSVPASTDARNAGEIWLCALTRSVPIAIARGENSGRTITYHNVLRRWVKLGEWNGAARTWSVPVADLDKDANAVSVLVQAGGDDTPGRMLGAAIASIK
jgi:hypothetical protein